MFLAMRCYWLLGSVALMREANILPTGHVGFVESRMNGQGLRSNPEGLALRDQTGRHMLF